MRAIIVLAAVIAMLAPAARAESPAVLRVRLYNSDGLAAPAVIAARDGAASIVNGIGLNVVFRLCGRAAEAAGVAADPCADPLKPSEVVVRLINAPTVATPLHSDAFGVAYVLRETGRGWLATVFADRIVHAAARVGVEAGTLAGRVIAHEIGHLLLGPGYHSAWGVMRAEWPDQMITGTTADWRFSSREAARILNAF